MFKLFKKALKKIKKPPDNNRKFDYKKYWQERYCTGETSGLGSYGLLAEYKAEIINDYIKNNDIKSVIEFGCGDGNQLKLMNYEKYWGLDVAKSAIDICRSLFKNDDSKSFMLYDPKYFYNNDFVKADLVVCLDVLYHITDEDEFQKTLHDIFSCSTKYIILYTIIHEYESEPNSHIMYRDTMAYLSKIPDFKVERILEQKYKEVSSADFIFMRKKG